MVDTNTNLAAASLAFSVLSFVVLTFGLIMWQFPELANSIRNITNMQRDTSNISMMAILAGALSPDISLLIGFVSDIMNGMFRYSVTSIVGIFAVILHWILGKFLLGAPTILPTPTKTLIGVGTDVMAGGSIQPPFHPCTIRGLGMFEVKDSPMGMAALAAIFVVYFMDMLNKRTMPHVGGYLGFSAVILGLNLYTYTQAKCVPDGALIKGIALPMVVGLAVGGISYLVMKSKYPEFLPLDAQPFDDGTPGIHPKCGQPSENEFVCDAYKNGKKISSAVVS